MKEVAKVQYSSHSRVASTQLSQHQKQEAAAVLLCCCGALWPVALWPVAQPAACCCTPYVAGRQLSCSAQHTAEGRWLVRWSSPPLLPADHRAPRGTRLSLMAALLSCLVVLLLALSQAQDYAEYARGAGESAYHARIDTVEIFSS